MLENECVVEVFYPFVVVSYGITYFRSIIEVCTYFVLMLLFKKTMGMPS